MNEAWRDLITPQVCEEFWEVGAVFVPKILHPDWLEAIEMSMTRVMNASGQTQHKFYEGLDGEFIETIRNFDVTPELQRMIYDSPVADMIGRLIDSENIWYFSDEMFMKEGGNCARTPWHQDTPYWPIGGNQIASAWISIDPLPKEECLEIIAGSHRQTMYDGFNPPLAPVDATAPYYGEEYPQLPDIEATRDEWDIRSWEVTPGDILFLHPSTLHGGGPTGAKGKRRAITIRCYGDDLTFARRPPTAPTAPRTPGLSLALNHGDPLRSPYYPQLRPAPVQ